MAQRNTAQHVVVAVGDKSRPAEIASHAVSRTLRTASMVFVLSAVFSFVGMQDSCGRPDQAGLWQPVVAALVGLIPSCATSLPLRKFSGSMLSFPYHQRPRLELRDRAIDTD